MRVRTLLILSLVSSASLFVASPALAGDVATGGAPILSPNTSTGAAALHFESSEGLPTSIQTGFLGPSIAKVNVGIKIGPVSNGGPLYAVDMPRGALVQASWGTDKRVVLSALGGLSTDGLVSVRHTLTPSIDFDFSFIKFSFDATTLLNFVPGASFNFDSHASHQFSPWAFTAVDTKLTAPDLDNAELFSLGMNELPEFVAAAIDGSFGVRATTEPTFSYKTTSITLAGAGGAIGDPSAQVTLPAVDGDAMNVMATVTGTMTVTGSIQIQPFVRLEKLAGLPLPIDLGIDVFSQDYTVPAQPVTFQTVNVHIPMPNVHAPPNADVGSGSTVSIENSGEKEAAVSFESSTPDLAVTADHVTIPPKSKYDLAIRVTAADGKQATGEIKVLSNDADSPEQTITINASGSASAPGGDDKDPASAGKADDGCGCHAAGAAAPPRWASLGVLGAVAIALLRRRRK